MKADQKGDLKWRYQIFRGHNKI